MTFGLKYQPRQVFRNSGFPDSGAQDNFARDNEEAVIGTQLWLGIGTAMRVGWRSLRDANRIASIWFQQC